MKKSLICFAPILFYFQSYSQDLDWGFNSGHIYNVNLSGRVGIGTNNPSETLHINGNIRGNQSGAIRVSTGSGYIDIGPKNSSWAHFYTDRPRFFFAKGITVDQGLIGSYNENLQLQTSGATRVTINNSSGNVGIGLTSPSQKLDVNGHVRVRNNLYMDDGDILNIHGIQMKDWDDNSGGTNSKYRLLARDGAFQFYNGGVVVGNYNDGTWSDLPDGRLIVEDRIGIGTTGPSEKLDVNGTARFRGVTQDNTKTRILVADTNGKLFWRADTSLPNTDSQTLSIVSNSLSITSGNSVDLTSYLDNTDAQTLSLSGTNLFISGGNTVDLSSLGGGSSGDNLGNHTPTQSIIPSIDNSYDLGSSSASFKDIHFDGTIYQNGKLLIHTIGGSDNIFAGIDAGNTLLTAKWNTALGARSLKVITSGNTNSAIGYESLKSNTSGHSNSALGGYSLRTNIEGSNNTASGYASLYSNIGGSQNSAYGFGSLYENVSGNLNTAVGSQSARNNSTGDNNVAVGAYALNYNVSGSNNTSIGYFSGPPAPNSNLNNTTSLGNGATVTASNQVRVGNSSVTDIGGQVSWSTLSDGRFKKELKEDIVGLNFINSLKPVSYQVDNDKLNRHLGIPDSIQAEMKALDAKFRNANTLATREIGFVAQDVVTAMKQTDFEFNAVHIPENEHDHYTIRYAEFVVPLVKAVQELSAMVETQQQELTRLKSQLAGSVNQDGDTKSLEQLVIMDNEIKLFQNTPNPFNQSTSIKMQLPERVQQADLMIYNLEGKQVDHRSINSRGLVEFELAGGSLDAGMYIYALIVDGEVVDQKRMILTQ